MIKSLKKLGIEGACLYTIKALFDKPVANIKLNREKLKPFLLKSGTRLGCPVCPNLFNIDINNIKLANLSQSMIISVKFPQVSLKDAILFKAGLFISKMCVFRSFINWRIF
jgi:hypothetical protein